MLVHKLRVVIALLSFERGTQAKQRARITRVSGQIIAKDLFRFRCVACHEQCRSQRLTHRINPILWLVIVERVLHGDCLAQLSNCRRQILPGHRNLRTQRFARNGEHVFCFVIHRHGENFIRRRACDLRTDEFMLGLRLGQLTFASKGHATSEMPDGGRRFHGSIRRRHGKNFVPFLEPHSHHDGHGHKAFQRRHIFHRGCHVGGELVGSLPGIRITPFHSGGNCDEVQIVGVVHHGIHALRACGCDVGLVHLSGVDVRTLRRVKVAGADISMRGHVDEMSRPRR